MISYSYEPIPDNAPYAARYAFLEQYASDNSLSGLSSALPIVHSLMLHAAESDASRFHVQRTHMGYWQHALNVCNLLIDLHIPLDRQEEDILLCAALCHILPENLWFEDLCSFVTKDMGLLEEVYTIVNNLFFEDNNSGAEQDSYFMRLRENKLSLMIKLADRSNLVAQLYIMSNWNARRYIYETRNFYFPMCTYAKETYPQLFGAVSVLMEKIRCLIEAVEILLNKYETKENELMQDILALEEENIILRRMIDSVKKNP